MNKGVEYKDIAVLYRVHAQSLPILDQMVVNKIPYQVYSDFNFLARKEIKAILAYMKLIATPFEIGKSDVWEIANYPLRYIKKLTVEQIEDEFDSGAYDSFYDALISYEDIIEPKQARCIGNLVNDIRKGQKFFRKEAPNADELIRFILEDLGVEAWYKTPEGSNSDVQFSGEDDLELNIDVLKSMSSKYPHVDDFLNFADGLSRSGKKKKKDPNENAVHLLTIHASKGLEFKNVIIAGMCSRTMPFYKANDAEQYEEERRIAYVGMTRAENNLFLSSINGRMGRFKVRSSFYLNELGLR